MAISRRTIKQVPRKFVKQDGGLVQYGLGGIISGIGAVASMIPTPWTQLGGLALSGAGAVMEGIGSNNAASEENANQLRMQGDAAQAGVYNPYRPTFAMGGKVGKPNQLDYTGMGTGFMNTIHPRNPNNKLSKRLYNTIKPDDYPDENISNKWDSPLTQKAYDFITNKNRFKDLSGEYSKIFKQIKEADKKRDFPLMDKLLEQYKRLSLNKGEDDPYSEDAWAMYLGLEQKNSTFKKSDYKPTKGKDNNSQYYNLPDEFKSDLLELYKKGIIEKGLNTEGAFPRVFGEEKSRARVLGDFTVDEGEDKNGKYISYYDKYDLAPTLPVVGKTKMDIIGKPFEIYDRIYLNENKEIPKKAMGGVISGMAPNVNVEGGEVIQGADGSVAEVKGSKHSQGGVNLHMKDGGRVFSDQLINPQTGNTFAEDAEKYMKMIK